MNIAEGKLSRQLLNLRNHYHNGGIWPHVGGMWVRLFHRLGTRALRSSKLGELNRRGIRRLNLLAEADSFWLDRSE